MQHSLRTCRESRREGKCSSTVGCGGLQKDIQIVGMNRAKLSVFAFDAPAADERYQGFLQGERAAFFREWYLLVEVLQIVFTDVLPRAVSHHQEFRRRHAPAVLRWQQNLSQHGGKRHG